MNGIIDFSEAGEGVAIRLRAADLLKIQERFGARWFTDIVQRLEPVDPEFFGFLLALGGLKDGEPAPIRLDELGELTGLAAERAADAVFAAVFEQRLREYLQLDNFSPIKD